MDLFVKPEITRRQSDENAARPYSLQRAQIIFYPDGKKPTVRLNDEVKILVEVKLKDDVPQNFKIGDPVTWDNIERIERTKLTNDDDPNCGHATLLFINGGWHVSFDFIYNRALSRSHLEAAKQFLLAAAIAKDKKHWAVFIDNLCSASELTAKAYLLSSPDSTVKSAKSHNLVKSRANKHGQLGNLQKSHVESFNKVWRLRNPARYLEGTLSINDEEADSLIKDLEDFSSYVEQRTKSDL